MRTLQTAIAVISVGIVCQLALATSSGTMYVTYTGCSPGITTDLSVDYNHDGTADEVYGAGGVYVGTYNLADDPTKSTGDGVTISTVLCSTIHAYCMDVRQNAPGDYLTYQVTDLENGPVGGGNTPMGTTRANQIRELFGRYYQDTFDNTHAAAFQAAIWEIENERTGNALDVNAGDLIVGHTSTDMQTIADSWLASLTGDSRFFDPNVWSITSPSNQDYVFRARGSLPLSVVPEPLTLTAVVLAMSGLGLYVRRRTKPLV